MSPSHRSQSWSQRPPLKIHFEFRLKMQMILDVTNIHALDYWLEYAHSTEIGQSEVSGRSRDLSWHCPSSEIPTFTDQKLLCSSRSHDFPNNLLLMEQAGIEGWDFLPSIFSFHTGYRKNRPLDGESLTQSRTPEIYFFGFHTTTICRQGIVCCIPLGSNVCIPRSILHRLSINAFSYTFHFSSRRDYSNPGFAALWRIVCHGASALRQYSYCFLYWSWGIRRVTLRISMTLTLRLILAYIQ